MRSILTDKVSATMPLPEYPRPQLVRDGWQNLNGLYDYKISDSSEKKPTDIDGKILVPFAPECFLSKVEKGCLLYTSQKTFYLIQRKYVLQVLDVTSII